MKTGKRHLSIILSVAMVVSLFGIQCTHQKVMPENWWIAWSSPSSVYRPLQIVHGTDIRNKASYFKDSCGLGGVVCNVPFGEQYLKSEKDWEVFTDGVKAIRSQGLRVWIYDEDGYPSLGAGGRVLEADPSLEALEMVYDKGNRNPFVVRPCYEYTHACNNFYVARRYPNPLNYKATQKFIELTHQAYFHHLGPDLFGEVEAFFTDEPSMMAVNLGELNESVRKNVQVTDPLDVKKKNLPMISWSEDLPAKYKEKYGEELITSLGSLFSGEEEKDKVVRQKFWSLLAELDKEYYYNAIQEWCRTMRKKNGGIGPVSSGHCLREEYPAIHVPLDGNKLLAGTGFDIPGLDQLSSDPSIWNRDAWMSVFFPASSAVLTGQRRIMCEMSDFSQTMGGKGPASIQQMQAATAWQMAFGVTDFTLYYAIAYSNKYPYRNETAYKAYCDFIGRVNSMVMDAMPVRKVLLYYPVYDLQREYIPAAEKMSSKTQSRLSKTIESSFRDLGTNLLKAQIPFVLVDYLTLEKATFTENGTMRIGKDLYSTLLFPKDIVFSHSISGIIAKAKENGVKIVMAGDFSECPSPDQLFGVIGDKEKIIPSCSDIAMGKFTREGRKIFLITNTGDENYTGALKVAEGNRYVGLDPQTGETDREQKIPENKIKLNLAPLQSKIFVIL